MEKSYIILGLGVLFLLPTALADVACTMEAKICQDGTAVGRMPPNCEFAPCPGEQADTVQISLSQGWNLVALPGTGQLSSGDCTGDVYALIYLRDKGRFATLGEASASMGEEAMAESMRLNSFWVYSFSPCSMEFTLTKATWVGEITLDEGWNFLPIISEMEGASLDDVGGDCVFDRVYGWGSVEQEWRARSTGDEFATGSAPAGFAAKVNRACSLGAQ